MGNGESHNHHHVDEGPQYRTAELPAYDEASAKKKCNYQFFCLTRSSSFKIATVIFTEITFDPAHAEVKLGLQGLQEIRIWWESRIGRGKSMSLEEGAAVTAWLLSKNFDTTLLRRTSFDEIKRMQASHCFHQIYLVYAKMFDLDKNSKISYEEWISGFVILAKGTFEEKAKASFDAIDHDMNGVIDKKEMSSFLKAIFSSFKNAPNETELRSVVDEMFDEAGDEDLTWDRFYKFVQQNQSAAKLLVFLNSDSEWSKLLPEHRACDAGK